MKLRYRILGVVGIVIVLAFLSLAIVLSHNSPCAASDASDAAVAAGEGMKAVVYRCYGAPAVLQVEEVAKPAPTDDQVLVKVRAAALNPLDWHSMRGSPYVMRLGAGLGTPKDPRMGVDFAGIVEAVGKNVTRFKPGDEVFGARDGALAQYVTVRHDRALALKPANITFEQAASVPVAAITALQGLRDQGAIQSGQQVLINGASGGVGTFAVQIAKSFGAEVTAVCSTRNVELVRSLGADHVFDYTREDFTRSGRLYDLVLDNVANRSPAQLRRVLKPNGTLVIIGGAKGDWIGPFMSPLEAMLLSPFVDQKMVFMLAKIEQEDLVALGNLMQAGKVTPVIDKRYALGEVQAAMAYLEEGRARGKVVVTID